MNLLFCDDEKLLRVSVAALIKKWWWIKEVDTVADGEELWAKLQQKEYNIVLLDVNLPGKNGIEIAKLVLRDYPSIRLIMLTNHSGEALLVTLHKLGVHGIILKDTDSDELERAVKKIAGGENHYSEVAQKIINVYGTGVKVMPSIHFAQRHKQVLELLLKGRSSKEIAEKLHVSLHTVNSYKRDMLEHTQTQSTNELLAFVSKNGVGWL
jgi:DNA-binding NarL/FixJ family response regulator